MNYQEFRCEFLERMKEVMEEGVSITTEKINKNNGVVMEGLVLKRDRKSTRLNSSHPSSSRMPSSA